MKSTIQKKKGGDKSMVESIQCEDCCRRISLESFTNTCYTCGADYSLQGDRLAPRSQWGLETGESIADILGPWDPATDY